MQKSSLFCQPSTILDKIFWYILRIRLIFQNDKSFRSDFKLGRVFINPKWFTRELPLALSLLVSGIWKLWQRVYLKFRPSYCAFQSNITTCHCLHSKAKKWDVLFSWWDGFSPHSYKMTNILWPGLYRKTQKWIFSEIGCLNLENGHFSIKCIHFTTF